MSIANIVPLVPLMAQVAETHINECTFFANYHIILYFFTSNELKLLGQISDHIYVSVCASATCAISGTSGTN